MTEYESELDHIAHFNTTLRRDSSARLYCAFRLGCLRRFFTKPFWRPRSYHGPTRCSSFFIILLFAYAAAFAAELSHAQALEVLEGEFLTLFTVGLNLTSKNTASAITSDSKGNVYITGTTDAFERGGESDLVSTDEENLSGKDAFIAKISATSNTIEWIVRTGSSGDDEGKDIAVNEEGTALYVLGRTNGQYGTIPRNGQYDIFLVKYNVGNPGKPTQEWGGPKLFGSASSETPAVVKLDSTGQFVYVIGHSRGQLYTSSSGSTETDFDAIIFRCQASDGTVAQSHQFGTDGDDTAKSLVLPEPGGEFLTVGVDSVRRVGNVDIKNMNIFTLKLDDLTVATSALVKTFSPEAVSDIVLHPLFPGSIFVGGSSWLSSISGWDFAMKKLDKITAEIDSESDVVIDVGSLGKQEYSQRRGSIDNANDLSVNAKLSGVSGRIWVAGTTGGRMTEEVTSPGSSQIVLAAVDPETGAMTAIAQEEEDSTEFTSIAGFTFSPDSSGVIYVGTRLEESSGNLYTIVGSYGIPVALQAEIPIPVPLPSPNASPDPSGDRDISNGSGSSESGPNMVIIIGGAAGGAVVVTIIAVAVCALMRTKKESDKLKFGQGRDTKRATRKPEPREKIRRPPPAAQQYRQQMPDRNTSGLV